MTWATINGSGYVMIYPEWERESRVSLGQADVYLVAVAVVALAHLPRLFPTIYCLE